MTSIRAQVIAGVGVVVAVLALGTSVAGAGGWAVSSLDAVAPPVAGRAADVGFTIRQHGQTPVNPEGEVGVGIRSASGASRFFAARPEGPVGHYVARVRFPEAGRYTWEIRQGWFAPQDLGPIDVSAPAAAGVGAAAPTASGTGSGTAYRWPLSVRLALPALGLALGAFAVGDAVLAHRRRSRRPIAT